MKDEYIVINKTKLKERIENCNKQISILQRLAHNQKDRELEITNIAIGKNYSEKDTLFELQSNSTQLTPLLQNAFDESRRQHSWAGGNLYGDGYNEEQDLTDFKYSTSQDYINNLKLDI